MEHGTPIKDMLNKHTLNNLIYGIAHVKWNFVELFHIPDCLNYPKSLIWMHTWN